MNVIGPLSLVDSVEDFGTTELYAATASVVTEINGTVYVFVAGYYDGGIQVLRLEGEELVPVHSFSDNDSVGLYGPTSLQIVDTGAERYLVVLSPGEDAITSFRIDQTAGATEGQLFAADMLASTGNGGTVPDFDSAAQQAQATTSAGHFVITAGNYSDSVNVFRIGADGRFTLVDSVLDSEAPDLNLNGATSVAVHQSGGNTFVFVGSDTYDNGISVFSMSAAGVLTTVQNIDVNAVDTYSTVADMTVVAANGRNYLVACDTYEDVLHVYQIAANGALTEVSSLATNVYGTAIDYNNIARLDTMIVNGVAFVVASSSYDDAVVVFGLDQNGILDKVQDLALPELSGVAGVTAFFHNGRQYILGAAESNSRITLLEVGGAADPLVATTGNDRIVGLGGDDDLVALGGHDTVFGGAGDDMLSGRGGNDVLDGGADNDVVLGGAGNDSITGGNGADFLLGGGGFDLSSYAGSRAGVVVNLLTGAASGGDAAGDGLNQIEGLLGSAFTDVLTGDNTANRLEGGGARDLLYGAGGADILRGGLGNDLLSGGDAADRLSGDGGNDSLLGGAAGDNLRGGNGNDTLLGDAGNDQLFGDADADHLTGGAGDDTMDGGAGADIFHFALGLGADEIANFAIAGDRLDFSTIAEIDSLADFRAAAVSFGGNTVISLSDGSSIYLTGVVETQFTDANFLY